MISLNYKFNGAELPLTIEKIHLISFFMENKGKAFELMTSLIVELKKDNSDIIKLKLKELETLLKN